eukprot:60378_1
MATCSHSVVYMMGEGKKWNFKDTQGALFVCERSNPAGKYSIFVLNRQTSDNLVHVLKPSMKVEDSNEGYVFYSMDGDVYAIWCYVESERICLYRLLTDLVSELRSCQSQPSSQSPSLDFQMASSDLAACRNSAELTHEDSQPSNAVCGSLRSRNGSAVGREPAGGDTQISSISPQKSLSFGNHSKQDSIRRPSDDRPFSNPSSSPRRRVDFDDRKDSTSPQSLPLSSHLVSSRRIFFATEKSETEHPKLAPKRRPLQRQ